MHCVLVPTRRVNAIKLSRHSGMDRRNLGCMDASSPRHPWNLDSGIPCRNDGQPFNLMAVTRRVGMQRWRAALATGPQRVGTRKNQKSRAWASALATPTNLPRPKPCD